MPIRRIPPEAYYLHAPMTHRDGMKLAGIYGYPSVEAFAEELPQNATAIDFGAGFSTLGAEVCALRSDVEWTNADIQYGSNTYKSEYKKILNDAPPNLNVTNIDVLKPFDRLSPGTFDVVLSYYMLPYLYSTSRHAVTG